MDRTGLQNKPSQASLSLRNSPPKDFPELGFWGSRAEPATCHGRAICKIKCATHHLRRSDLKDDDRGKSFRALIAPSIRERGDASPKKNGHHEPLRRKVSITS